MATLVSTSQPVAHKVFNEFDRHGLLFGLSRIDLEKNAEYKQRIIDVFVHRASSTYRGLINSISRELGISFRNVLNIQPVFSGGVPLAAVPAVVFIDTKCYLYENYSTGELLMTIDLFDPDQNANLLINLRSRINSSVKYNATLLDSSRALDRSQTIIAQSSVGLVEAESLVGFGTKIKLANSSIINTSVSITSSTLSREVFQLNMVSNPGDYFIDYDTGLLTSYDVPDNAARIRYNYRNDSMNVEASDVILHNMQSEDFKTKLFNQINDDQGNKINGEPTAFGAYLINELYTVHGVSFGV